jgi:nicotinate-nucleotide pyrophosphorylase (carboxylating)
VKFESYLRFCFWEDLQEGDITALTTIPKNAQSKGKLVAKEAGVFTGNMLVKTLFRMFAPKSQVINVACDGAVFKKGDELIKFEGNAIELLSLERTLINFLQHLCGVATLTSKYAKALGESRAFIYDTRKTTPGMRELEKQAVVHGGGKNHRQGLYDAVLIKENHILAAGSITKAVDGVRSSKLYEQKRYRKDFFIEVETKNQIEVEEALAAKVDIIMLDNMTMVEMQKDIQIIRKGSPTTQIEISGNVTYERLPELGKLDIDRISIGAITHSAKSIDLSMLFE